jgi:predicted Zn-ribbon and HTH transcriptional regulator
MIKGLNNEFIQVELECNACGEIFLESTEFDGAYYCPHCNSDNVEDTSEKLYKPIIEYVSRECNTCGHTWDEPMSEHSTGCPICEDSDLEETGYFEISEYDE